MVEFKQFNSLKEIEKYYDKEDNTYVFEEDGEPIRLVKFNFDFLVRSNIEAYNINAGNIIAHNINANDINAYNVIADDINARDIDIISITALDINVNDINALDINARDITARNIKARNISAEDIWGRDIYAKDITAQNIKADDISYYALCFAYNNIKCKTITGRRNKHKHFVLDGELVIKNNNW